MARGFGSDNHSGVHPDVLAELGRVNVEHVPSYGADAYTEEVLGIFRQHFGEVDVHFVFNGTAANVLSIRAMTQSHHAVICAATAHLHVDECGAPEAFTGCKLLLSEGVHGKLSCADIERHLVRRGDQHVAQPRVVSISQPTELGTVYTVAELRALSAYVHEQRLLLHMDGARLVNAAVSLGVSLRELTTGVDVLSFGGTKNGLLFGEAVVFFERELGRDFKFVRKQAMQLASKTRFIAAQFRVFLGTDLWQRNAAHANAMAKRLEEAVRGHPDVRITHPVQANAVFAILPRALSKRLREHYFFYVWDERSGEVRLMTTFDTQPEDVDAFAAELWQSP